MYSYLLSSRSTVYISFNTATEDDVVVVVVINDDDDAIDEDDGGGDVLVVHWVPYTGGKMVHCAEKGIQTQRNLSLKANSIVQSVPIVFVLPGCRNRAV